MGVRVPLFALRNPWKSQAGSFSQLRARTFPSFLYESAPPSILLDGATPYSRGILRRPAQYRDATRGLPWPNPGRDVLRYGGQSAGPTGSEPEQGASRAACSESGDDLWPVRGSAIRPSRIADSPMISAPSPLRTQKYGMSARTAGGLTPAGPASQRAHLERPLADGDVLAIALGEHQPDLEMRERVTSPLPSAFPHQQQSHTGDEEWRGQS